MHLAPCRHPFHTDKSWLMIVCPACGSDVRSFDTPRPTRTTSPVL